MASADTQQARTLRTDLNNLRREKRLLEKAIAKECENFAVCEEAVKQAKKDNIRLLECDFPQRAAKDERQPMLAVFDFLQRAGHLQRTQKEGKERVQRIDKAISRLERELAATTEGSLVTGSFGTAAGSFCLNSLLDDMNATLTTRRPPTTSPSPSTSPMHTSEPASPVPSFLAELQSLPA